MSAIKTVPPVDAIESKSFKQILPEEHVAIEQRRIEVARARELCVTGRRPALLIKDAVGGKEPPRTDRVEEYTVRAYDTVGLALSGGGIRSATVCLGVLQALQSKQAIDSIDYLSTVSGGGYIGCATVAGVSSSQGGFPFQAPGAKDDVSDSAALGYLRNYSSYLLPRNHGAFRNAAEIAVIFLRGLLINALFAGLVIAFVAVLMAGAYGGPGKGKISHLYEGGLLLRLLENWRGGRFECLDWPFSLTGASIALLGLALFIWVLARSFGLGRGSDVDSMHLRAGRLLATLIVALFIADVLPLLLAGLLELRAKLDVGQATASVVLPGLLSMATTVVVFSGRMAEFLKGTSGTGEYATLVKRALAKAALILAAAIVPLTLLLVLLIASAWLAQRGWEDWLFAIGCWIAGLFVLLVATIKPNAYSLHQLYRDRLSNAFLSFPYRGQEWSKVEALGGIKLSQIDIAKAPYPIINAAINLQGSYKANMRGRHADFFVFTPKHVGADLTRYVDTALVMEKVHPKLDLATAMAISGAAVSSNMGSASIKALAPTLALLNFRLGYWLPNPEKLCGKKVSQVQTRAKWGRVLDNLFLVQEIFSKLDENKPDVYLTDGGHIENLGVYQLLKRGCALIVVVDAEADPDYAFHSLLRLERYARIDLGVRIDLPWGAIASTSRTLDAAYAAKLRPDDPKGSDGPHSAVGTINYPDGAKGTLLYVKASLTGDERDYVLDYKRRYPSFPHETTGDQFFSEEQFEAYRWLGFHMMSRILEDRDTVAMDAADPTIAAYVQGGGLRKHLWTMV